MEYVPAESRPFAGFRGHLCRGAWFLANDRDGFSLFLFFFFLGGALTAGNNSSLGLFCPAMVAMPQRLDARSLLFSS
jgi:hypothetical protein